MTIGYSNGGDGQVVTIKDRGDRDSSSPSRTLLIEISFEHYNCLLKEVFTDSLACNLLFKSGLSPGSLVVTDGRMLP
jgi:hypothetical protein